MKDADVETHSRWQFAIDRESTAFLSKGLEKYLFHEEIPD